MKHPISTTAILLLLFVCAQLIGLSLLSINSTEGYTGTGERIVLHEPPVVGAPPEMASLDVLLYIAGSVAIGTALVMLIIKFKVFRLWKIWFLLAAWISMSIALGVLMPSMLAFIIALVFAAWKVFKPNPVIHNSTEVLMYSGLALFLVPLFQAKLWLVIILLVIVSVYDIIAVWYSKHMVTMAKAQQERNLFAGLYIPKKEMQEQQMTISTPEAKHAAAKEVPPPPKKMGGGAILGGGDIAFPLLFSGVLMDWLLVKGIGKTAALYESIIITITATIALTLLFVYAKKDKFYPAMPFLTAGCLAGLGVVMLII